MKNLKVISDKLNNSKLIYEQIKIINDLIATETELIYIVKELSYLDMMLKYENDCTEKNILIESINNLKYKINTFLYESNKT